jgi:hypothetical protein
MKNIITLFLLCLVLLSCNNTQSNGSIAPGNAGDRSAIASLDNSYTQEIMGLWKLYKTMYSDSSSMVERNNTFLEIKSSGEFVYDNRGGNWFLSFRNDSAGVKALFTAVYKSSYDASVTPYYVEKTVENGTTYLRLSKLSDRKQLFFIRQQ